MEALDYERLPDAELAARFAAKDPVAVRVVTKRCNQRLFRAAWSVVKNRAEAEDVVQETYLRALAAAARFEGRASLSTWLTRIAINEALERKRTAERRAAALAEQQVTSMDAYREKQTDTTKRQTPEAELARKEFAQILETAIAALPEIFRTVFVLREIEELSIEETANALGIPADTVKTRLLRARRRIRQSLDPEVKSALGETFPFAGADCEALTASLLARLGLDNKGETS